MYIIISNILVTNDIFARAKFATRLEARKNLLKEAQNWICTFRPNYEWEIIAKESDAKTKTRYFIIRSETNEDVLTIYERVETVEKGWVYNNTNVALQKLVIFSVLEVAFDQQEHQEPRQIVFEMPKIAMTDDEKKVIVAKKNLVNDLKQHLAERRTMIE